MKSKSRSKTKASTKEIQLFLNLCKHHFPRLAWEVADLRQFPEFWQARQMLGVNAIAFAGVGDFWAIGIMLIATPEGEKLAHAEIFSVFDESEILFSPDGEDTFSLSEMLPSLRQGLNKEIQKRCSPLNANPENPSIFWELKS